jgi:hypothetical protein
MRSPFPAATPPQVGAVFGVMAVAQTQLSQYGVLYVIIYGMTFLFSKEGVQN